MINIAATNAEDNMNYEYSSFKYSEKEDFSCNFAKRNGTWIRWEVTKDACIKVGYSVHEPPKADMTIPLFLSDWATSVIEIHEKHNTLEIEFSIEMVWKDDRIQANFSNGRGMYKLPSVRKNSQPYLWIPTYYIYHAKQVRYMKDPVVYSWVRLVSNKMIKLDAHNPDTTLTTASMEWHVTISCIFDFSYYPLDEQNCNFKINLWDVNITLTDSPNFLENPKITEKRGFVITKESLETIVLEAETYGHLSQFGYSFHIKRLIKPYILQYYIPSFAIVIISFMSFIVPISTTPGRIALVVTQFLTLTNLFIHQRVMKFDLIKEPMLIVIQKNNIPLCSYLFHVQFSG